jgi:hypothetical protein
LRATTISRISLSCSLFLAAFLSLVPIQAAQSRPVSDAATVLREILMASCSQDAHHFGDFLTVRNAAAFSAMSESAQAALLQRFVLLDQAGKPTTKTDATGNLIVLCATPSVTTQLEIGKPEIRDNIAYLPLVVKDTTDTADANSRRVTMGLVRENNQWKLLSLGVLLLDLPTLSEEWDRAEIQNNEKAAAASIKELADAIEKYRVTYTHLPQTLAELGPAEKGAAKADRAGLIDGGLAAGRKDGYSFRYVIVGSNEVGAPAIYELAAIPFEYGRTGTRSFFRDGSGILHAADHQGGVGTVTDPKVD